MAKGSPIASLYVALGADVDALKSDLKKAENAVKGTGVKMQTSVKEAQATLANMKMYDSLTGGIQKSNEALGMSRREWMRTGSEAAFYARTALGGLEQVDSGVTKTIGVLTQLGESALFGGAAGIAVALVSTGIGLITAEAAKAKAEADKIVAPFIEVRKELEALAELKGIAKLAEDLGVSKDQLDKYLSSGKAAVKQTTDFVYAQTTVAEMNRQLKAATDAYNQSLAQYNMLVGKGTELEGVLAESTVGSGEALKIASDQVVATKQVMDGLSRGLGIASTHLDDLKGKTNAATKANEEFARITAAYTSGIPKAAQEIRNLAKELNNLKSQHLKAQAGFADDLTEAWKRAATQIIDIQSKTTQHIVDIQSDMLDQIKDLEHNALGSNTEAYYQYSKSIREMNYDLLQDAKKDAEKRLAIETELAKDIEGITRDSAEKEMTAPWSEVMKIRRDRDAAIKAANDKAKAARGELSTEQSDRQEAYNRRKGLLDEEYLHSKELRSQELQEAIERAQRQANKQIEEARRSEAEQVKASNDRYAQEKEQINKRSAEESAAYTKSVADAKAASAEQVKAILDTRTEAQKLAADWIIVKGNVDATTRSLIEQGTVLSAMGLSTTNWKDWKTPGWYQTEPGQSKIVPGSPNQVVPAYLHGGERVSRDGAGGGVTINFNAPVYGMDNLDRHILSVLDKQDYRK